MNKQEMKALALSKVEDKINMIINNINNNIKSLAEDGFLCIVLIIPKSLNLE